MTERRHPSGGSGQGLETAIPESSQELVRGSYRCDGCGKLLSPADAVISPTATLCPRCDEAGENTYPPVDPYFGHWLAGLSDGEACFYISRYGCRFQIHLRVDDEPMLEQIRAELGYGKINYNNSNASATRHVSVMYSVARKYDCLAIVRLFDQFPLRSKKARDYAIWRQAVLAHCAGTLPTELRTYREALAKARRHGLHDGEPVPYLRPVPVQPSLLDEVLP